MKTDVCDYCRKPVKTVARGVISGTIDLKVPGRRLRPWDTFLSAGTVDSAVWCNITCFKSWLHDNMPKESDRE